jgi:hypothetical protein
MSQPTKRHRAPVPRRGIAAAITLLTTAGTALAFLVVAYILATFNCEDGCPTGSRWAPRAWGSTVELWALALPAFLASCGLVCAVASGRRRTSILAWTISLGLLLGWCLFTGTSAVPINLSGTNSHWMWLAGLLLAGGGGITGIKLSSRKSKQ